jgi:hypothetical protein
MAFDAPTSTVRFGSVTPTTLVEAIRMESHPAQASRADGERG